MVTEIPDGKHAGHLQEIIVEVESKKLKVGDRVKYIGSETIAYENDKEYKIRSYNKKLDLYGVESELDEAYLLSESVLQKVE